MEKIGEKHAFFEKRKCGSRKVLRFMRSLLYALTVLSLPLRGAWIEIFLAIPSQFELASLPLRGAWIEMREALAGFISITGRSPCGERGLKFDLDPDLENMKLSLPMRGAWIEMMYA